MQKIIVQTQQHDYPIYITDMLDQHLALLKPHFQSQQCLIVTNDIVEKYYLQTVKSALAKLDINCDTLILHDGEQHKTLTKVNQIIDQLLQQRHDRSTTLCALGGGVIGDITGFAASCYRRGVNFLQIPTTLLAQVDASVGGKTGVNHPLGKNMIGSFYQPQAVLIATDTLNTLPEREFHAGLAEVIKYGLIMDADFFTWLESNIATVLTRDPKALAYCIARSCQLKSNIVAQDEREQGIRAILNFGHTFGHALEAATEYSVLLHGEAVAIGMVMAANLSEREGLLDHGTSDRIINLLSYCQLPTRPPDALSPKVIMQYMTYDKKIMANRRRLVLLAGIGKSKISSNFCLQNLTEIVQDACTSKTN